MRAQAPVRRLARPDRRRHAPHAARPRQPRHGRQPTALRVRRRARPRRPPPARPHLPAGLVDLQAGPADPQRRRRRLEARQWEADHFEDVPVIVVACVRGRRPVFPADRRGRVLRRRVPGGAEPPARGAAARPRRGAARRLRCGRPGRRAARSASRAGHARSRWSRSAGPGPDDPAAAPPVGTSCTSTAGAISHFGPTPAAQCPTWHDEPCKRAPETARARKQRG